MKRPAAAAAVLLAAGLALAGCQSHDSTDAAPPMSDAPQHASLVRAAGLSPCPGSGPARGDLPDLTLPCLGNGPAVHLAGLTGKPTVVNIWASWCPPCQQEAAYFAAAYDADKHDVRFLGVDTKDSDDSALDFAAHVHPALRYPSVVDADNKVLLGLGIPSPPLTVFLDGAGRIVHRHSGPYASTGALQRDIATYLHVRT